LEFWIVNGSSYQGVVKAAADSRKGLPEKFIEIGEMTEPWMAFYIESFFELSTERSVGMGIGPIPWSSIFNYASAFEFTGSDYHTFHSIIRAMDSHYLRMKANDSKRIPEANGNSRKKHKS
jgi:hypothetical protein